MVTVPKGIGFANVGSEGVTTLSISGGLLNYTGSTTTANPRFGLGGGQTVYLTGGTIETNGGVAVGNTANAGFYRITNSVGPDNDYSIYALPSAAPSVMSGGIEVSSSPGTFNVASGGTFTVSAAIFNDVGGGSAGSIVSAGSGLLVFTASDTYTGTTTVSAGMLIVNGSLVSPVTVNGGTLAGTGRLTSVTVNSGGSFAATRAGQLTLSGSLSLLAGAKMDYELDTPLDSDQVLMPSGALTLGGQQFSDFNFTPLAGFGPGKYTLIDAGSIGGNLGTSNSGSIDGFPAMLAIQGNNLVLNVVPEPSAIALLAAGAVSIARFRAVSAREADLM